MKVHIASSFFNYFLIEGMVCVMQWIEPPRRIIPLVSIPLTIIPGIPSIYASLAASFSEE